MQPYKEGQELHMQTKCHAPHHTLRSVPYDGPYKTEHLHGLEPSLLCKHPASTLKNQMAILTCKVWLSLLSVSCPTTTQQSEFGMHTGQGQAPAGAALAFTKVRHLRGLH